MLISCKLFELHEGPRKPRQSIIISSNIVFNVILCVNCLLYVPSTQFLHKLNMTFPLKIVRIVNTGQYKGIRAEKVEC
jgi:hypothetical protein